RQGLRRPAVLVAVVVAAAVVVGAQRLRDAQRCQRDERARKREQEFADHGGLLWLLVMGIAAARVQRPCDPSRAAWMCRAVGAPSVQCGANSFGQNLPPSSLILSAPACPLGCAASRGSSRPSSNIFIASLADSSNSRTAATEASC